MSADRAAAPFERRAAIVTATTQHGPYTVLRAGDCDGPRPAPGQFYMLSAAARWGGGEGERPFLPRAFSVLRAPAGTDELHFLIEDVGPGTNRLCELLAGDRLLLVGPLGIGFSAPRHARTPLLVGGGVGIAPLAILQDQLGAATEALLGFRDAAHAQGAALLADPVLATDDGSVGQHGLVTDLLRARLDRAAHLEVYACGPPAMLESVQRTCAERAIPAQLALESGMACGFGACFGCVVPTRRGYVRLCLEGPVLDGSELVGHPRSRATTHNLAKHPRWRVAASERHLNAGTDTQRGGLGDARRRAPLRPIELCGIELDHRLINASGTFDAIAAQRVFGRELIEQFPFAAFVTKTVTLAPREGNPPPRLWELAGGMINSIGLPNKGLHDFLAQDLPALEALPVPLIVNVMGFSRDEVAELVATAAQQDRVAALELNVSCPNVETGLVMGADPLELAALLAHVRPLTDKPLIVKLTPNATDVAAVALAAQDAGASALSLINTVRGMALDPRSGRPWLGAATGGISGPAVRAVALAQVHAVASSVEIPVIGIGGVQRGQDAVDLIRAGARLVAVGTESFRDPAAARRIAAEALELLGRSEIGFRLTAENVDPHG